MSVKVGRVDLGAMRKRREELADRDSSRVTWFTAGQDENIIRILPPWEGSRTGFKECARHKATIRGKMRPYTCAISVGKKGCWTCDVAIPWLHDQLSKANDRDAEVLEKILADLNPSEQIFTNIIDRTDREGMKRGVQVWGFSQKMYRTILTLFDQYKSISDPDDGTDLILIRTGKGKNNTRYTGPLPCKDSAPVPDKYLDELYDLDDALKPLSEDEQAKILLEAYGIVVDEEGGEDEGRSRRHARRSEDEDDDERPRRRSRERDDDDDERPRSRFHRGDEEDEDEGRGSRRRLSGQRREEEEGDEDDEPPRRSRRASEEDDDEPPRRSRRASEEDDDEPPRRSQRAAEEEEPPRRRSTRINEDEDEEPPRGRRGRAEEEEEPPRRSRRGNRDEEPPEGEPLDDEPATDGKRTAIVAPSGLGKTEKREAVKKLAKKSDCYGRLFKDSSPICEGCAAVVECAVSTAPEEEEPPRGKKRGRAEEEEEPPRRGSGKSDNKKTGGGKSTSRLHR